MKYNIITKFTILRDIVEKRLKKIKLKDKPWIDAVLEEDLLPPMTDNLSERGDVAVLVGFDYLGLGFKNNKLGYHYGDVYLRIADQVSEYFFGPVARIHSTDEHGKKGAGDERAVLYITKKAKVSSVVQQIIERANAINVAISYIFSAIHHTFLQQLSADERKKAWEETRKHLNKVFVGARFAILVAQIHRNVSPFSFNGEVYKLARDIITISKTNTGCLVCKPTTFSLKLNNPTTITENVHLSPTIRTLMLEHFPYFSFAVEEITYNPFKKVESDTFYLNLFYGIKSQDKEETVRKAAIQLRQQMIQQIIKRR